MAGLVAELFPIPRVERSVYPNAAMLQFSAAGFCEGTLATEDGIGMLKKIWLRRVWSLVE